MYAKRIAKKHADLVRRSLYQLGHTVCDPVLADGNSVIERGIIDAIHEYERERIKFSTPTVEPSPAVDLPSACEGGICEHEDH